MREIGYAICVTLVVTAIFSMLLPKLDQNKTVQFAIRIFLLLSIALSFTGSKYDFSFDWTEYQKKERAVGEDLSVLARQQLLRSLDQTLRTQAEQILLRYGIVAHAVNFSIHIREDNRIDITNLTLVLEEKDWNRCEAAIAEINRTFALTATLQQAESTESVTERKTDGTG